MDNDGIACVSECGIEIVLRGEAPSKLIPTNVRWMAPEVLSTKNRPIPLGDDGKAADIYSFAVVMFEASPTISSLQNPKLRLNPRFQVLSGTTPFPNESDEEIADKVVTGLRPEWPSNNPSQKLVDVLWEHIESCWNQEPKERPTALSVLRALQELGGGEPPKPLGSMNGVEDDDFVHEPGYFLSYSEPPPLPPAPTNCFARAEIMTRLFDHSDRLASVVLSGSVGIGKTTIALTILHHSRVKAKFGDSRHFMRCDDLTNSLGFFLERLSDAIGSLPTRSMKQLRSHLARRPPLLLVLDGVDCVLDPLAPESEKISKTIEEICRCHNVCILITSRMTVDVPGFRTMEVATLSEDGARDTFYSMCHFDRSSAINDLIGNLDFHPLSVDLLARTALEHGWDEPRLLQEWDDCQTGMLRVDGCQSLETTIESALGSPTIQSLGPVARETLEAIAAFPCGVEEMEVGRRMFPGIDGAAEAVKVLCKFHLLGRRDGLVKILSPFRFYFLQCTITMVYFREDGRSSDYTIVEEEDGNSGNPIAEEEDEEDVPCNNARGGSSADL